MDLDTTFFSIPSNDDESGHDDNNVDSTIATPNFNLDYHDKLKLIFLWSPQINERIYFNTLFTFYHRATGGIIERPSRVPQWQEKYTVDCWKNEAKGKKSSSSKSKKNLSHQKEDSNNEADFQEFLKWKSRNRDDLHSHNQKQFKDPPPSPPPHHVPSVSRW